MIYQERGIKMCQYQKIREELGTVNYNQTSVKISNPKVNLVEMYEIEKKKEKKEKKKQKKVVKKVSIDEKKNKIEKIIDLVNLPEDINEKKEEIKAAAKKEDELEEHDEQEIQIQEKKEEELKENIDYDNTSSKKKIIFTCDTNPDKDKEMFQM